MHRDPVPLGRERLRHGGPDAPPGPGHQDRAPVHLINLIPGHAGSLAPGPRISLAGAATVTGPWLTPLVRHTIGMASSPAQACVFCGIIAGEVPASRVYEDDDVLAFMDVRPLTAGHLLVVPRAHAASLEDLDVDAGMRVFAAAHRLARALRNSAVPCEGVNFFLADGVAAGQEVFHVHLHLIPRTPVMASGSRPSRAAPGATNSRPPRNASGKAWAACPADPVPAAGGAIPAPQPVTTQQPPGRSGHPPR